MKRYLIMVLISILGINYAYSQTAEIEKEYMVKMYESKKVNLEEYQELMRLWQELMKDIEEYPNLPFDESLGIIKFEFIKDYSANKQIIFNRIKEWGAVNFGSLDAALRYEDLESGKIVLKGSFDIPYIKDVKSFWGKEGVTIEKSNCFHTYVFTIKDNKLKIQITGLNYEISYWTNYGSRIYTKSVNSLYPITADESLQWKSKLSLLDNTNNEINGLVNSLDMYIQAYQIDYDF